MIIDTGRITELSVSSTEPVTTAEAKAHMRVDISDDDTLIASLVSAARAYCEKYCNRSFVQHTYRADLAGFYDAMTLPMGPVQSVTHIKYYDTASPSVLTTLASSVYALNRDTVWRNYGASWESVYPRWDAVQVTYVTGWQDNSSPAGGGEAVSEAVKAAIKIMAAELYEHREVTALGLARMENPTIFRLLDGYRNYQ